MMAKEKSTYLLTRPSSCDCRKAGAKDNGKPGERKYTKGYYAAYVLDPDGNNVECVYYQPLWLSAIQWAPTAVGAAAFGALGWWAGVKGWGVV
jgi:hypothetical protein